MSTTDDRMWTRCYEAGVRDVLAIAQQAAEALKASPAYRPTRTDFAIAVLEELSAAGEELLIEAAATAEPEAHSS